jgi:hypothetical protein
VSLSHRTTDSLNETSAHSNYFLALSAIYCIDILRRTFFNIAVSTSNETEKW